MKSSTFIRYLPEEKPLLTACEATPTRMKTIRISFPVLPQLCLLLSSLVPALLLSGCMGNQKAVGPYAGRTQPQSSGISQQAAQPVQPTGPASAGQASYARDILMPALSRINGRITAYEQKVKSWQDLSSSMDFLNLSSDKMNQLSACRLQATGLLADYNRLHDQLLNDQSMDSSRWLVSRSLPAVEKKDIAHLEGDCTRLLFGSGFSSAAGSTVAGIESLEASMATALAAGDYGRVISDYQSLSLGPGEQPGFPASYSYGVALMKSGREQEARRAFNNLLASIREQDHGQLELKLLQLLGDLDFGLRDYSGARSRYEEIERVYGTLGGRTDRARQQLAALDSANMYSEEVGAYAALLLSYLAYDPQRDGFTVVQQAQAFQQRYPVSVVGSSVVELAGKADEDAEKWFVGLLDRVDRLSAEQKNQEALLLIERVPRDILPLDKQAILKLKKDALIVSFSSSPAETDIIQEEILQTTGPAVPVVVPEPGQTVEPGNTPDGHVPVTALQQTWDQGMANMQAKEYDKAIELFTGLLNTSDGTKAGLQIEEASRLAAQDDRKKAAELFVRANRATDPESRKELLLSSRVLLENILQKYPQSGLEEKVRRNLSRIDQELATVEQTLDRVSVNGEIRAQGIQDEPMKNMGER